MKLLALLEGWALFLISMWLCRSQGFFDNETFHPFSIAVVFIGIAVAICTMIYVVEELSEGR